MRILILTLLLGFTPLIANANPHDVYGIWLTEAGDGHIEISDCGDGTPCGVLVWVDPIKLSTDRDAQNPDPMLQERPLVGVPIVWGYDAGRNSWRRGQIYNPEDGKTFSSSMKKLENGNLKVKGCLGPLCITNIWTHVDQSSGKGGPS